MERTLTMITFTILVLIGAGLLVTYAYKSIHTIETPNMNCVPLACERSDSDTNDCLAPACVAGYCVQGKVNLTGTPCSTGSTAGHCVNSVCKV
jgi:hypothetical protein